jgi:vacuole morphology and inheritance protein 14
VTRCFFFIQDIALSSSQLDAAALVHEIKSRLDTKDPFGRCFNLGWTVIMQNYSQCNFVEYLPDFINALFEYLADDRSDIHASADRVLETFLRDVRANPGAAEMDKMVNFLILHAQMGLVRVQLVAVYWIREFLEMGGRKMLPYGAGIVKAVLPCISYDDRTGGQEQRSKVTVDSNHHI